MYKFDREKYDKRMQWFTHDRFGMFIHWGLYAIPARGEWVRSTEEIPEEDYIPFFSIKFIHTNSVLSPAISGILTVIVSFRPAFVNRYSRKKERKAPRKQRGRYA